MVCRECILVILLFNIAHGSKLFVLLVDGFRWDYFDLPGLSLKAFSRLREEGVKADYMIPDFPTNSFPNYRSIETGLHCESHGFVGNYMYDERSGETFHFVVSDDTDNTWFDGSEAFYVSAESQGFHTALYYVPSTSERLSTPSFITPYTGLTSREDIQWAMKHGLNRLVDGSADIIYLYHEQVDNIGHFHGPDSEEVRQAVQQLDDLLYEFLDDVDELNLTNSLDMILVSDHGMTNLYPNTVDISGAFNMEDVMEITEAGSLVYIWPNKGKLQKVYDGLKNYSPLVTVYYKAEIYDRWYLKKHRFVPPIIAVASSGWYIEHPKSHTMYSGYYKKKFVGNHGFDNSDEDMRSIFLAKGPSFKRGYSSKPFSNVNVYQLICHVTGIKPRPHNGTWSSVMNMLTDTKHLSENLKSHTEL